MNAVFVFLIDVWARFDWTIAFSVFLAYAIIDAFYAKYTLSVARLNPFSAATIGAVMHFLLAFGVLNYVQNYLYVVPLAIGSWLGTYWVVQREKSRISL
ncbi:MAG: Uncharacterized protein G01um101429_510 [Parcubacteria group bacterium Gr01-1014_29]|nr:MAG: Uncharacterized protein G01um101429_510 [Parcubacteria group bacterium Gr01-1014_29]